MGSIKDVAGPALLLDRPLNSVEELRPLPRLERVALGLTFRGEELHFGPPQRWLEREWELRLGSVDGVIYKVGLETRATNRDDAVEIATSVSSVLKRLGAGNQEGLGIFVWDAHDGNAVLQLANVGGDRRVMVFLTSNAARGFALR